MRYNLGLMDCYPIEAAGSSIENTPMYRVFLKQSVDPLRLESAFRKAIEVYPLFGTKVLFDKTYYLSDNGAQLKIIKAKEEQRPLCFGRNTNDYPWQCCYFENKITFEWLHGVSDGVGALDFLKQTLLFYFDADSGANKRKLVAPGLEPFFDSRERGIDFRNEPEGFSFRDFPKKYDGYRTDSYLLRTRTADVISVAKITHSSVAPVISILFSQAIRKHLKEGMKNRNVACNVVLDLRRPLDYDTMHNCVEYKRITYTDERAKMSFTGVAEEYKRILDNARKKPNVVRIISERVKLFKAYHFLPFRWWLKFCVKMVGKVLKDKDCNFVLTYPGRIELPEEVMERIDSIDFKVWHDFGEAILAAVDFNGVFNLNISENFTEKGIVDDFIELSHNVGIEWEITEKGVFEQAHFEE